MARTSSMRNALGHTCIRGRVLPGIRARAWKAHARRFRCRRGSSSRTIVGLATEPSRGIRQTGVAAHRLARAAIQTNWDERQFHCTAARTTSARRASGRGGDPLGGRFDAVKRRGGIRTHEAKATRLAVFKTTATSNGDALSWRLCASGASRRSPPLLPSAFQEPCLHSTSWPPCRNGRRSSGRRSTCPIFQTS